MKITTYQVHGVLKNYTRKLKRRRRKENSAADDLGASHLESRRNSIVKKITSEILEQIARSSQDTPTSGLTQARSHMQMQRSVFAYQTIDDKNCRSVRIFSMTSGEESEPETPA